VLTAAAGSLLLFPLVVLRVDPVEKSVGWHWGSLGWAAAALFALTLAWRLRQGPAEVAGATRTRRAPARLGTTRVIYASGAIVACALPLLGSTHQVNVLTSALIAVILALGLNVIVGLAGCSTSGSRRFPPSAPTPTRCSTCASSSASGPPCPPAA